VVEKSSATPGRLFRSLAAGILDRPSGASGQVIRQSPGVVIVGTNVKPWTTPADPNRTCGPPFLAGGLMRRHGD